MWKCRLRLWTGQYRWLLPKQRMSPALLLENHVLSHCLQGKCRIYLLCTVHTQGISKFFTVGQFIKEDHKETWTQVVQWSRSGPTARSPGPDWAFLCGFARETCRMITNSFINNDTSDMWGLSQSSYNHHKPAYPTNRKSTDHSRVSLRSQLSSPYQNERALSP